MVNTYQKRIVDDIDKLVKTNLSKLETNTDSPKPKPSKILNQAVYEMLMFSFLLGMEHTTNTLNAADQIEKPLSFDEAAQFLAHRIPLTKSEFGKLDSKMRLRAFSVARLSQLDAIERVKQLIEDAISKGQTQKQVLENLSKDEILSKLGFSLVNPWYFENVFRTNVQSAYNAGRALQIKKTKPEYLQFVGIDDARQTQICRARSGIIKPADDPFWESNWPPLHFSCRSTIRPVYKEEFDAFGYKKTDALSGMDKPMKGFGANPLDSESFYRLTPKMKERAQKYGIYEEIKALAEELGVEI
jgi:SPP1 gp7 family putative phage head morphogenesis protein